VVGARESALLTVSIRELRRVAHVYYWCARARTTERVVAQTKLGPEQ